VQRAENFSCQLLPGNYWRYFYRDSEMVKYDTMLTL